MKLPRGKDAIIPEGKVRSYCLSAVHDDGRHKSLVFASALGSTLANAETLERALLAAASSSDALLLFNDRYGTRYRVDFPMTHAGRTRIVRSGWIIHVPRGPPYLSTAFVLPSSHG